MFVVCWPNGMIYVDYCSVHGVAAKYVHTVVNVAEHIHEVGKPVLLLKPIPLATQTFNALMWPAA